MKSYRKINKREQEKRLEWVKLSYAYRKSMKRVSSWKNRNENGMSPEVHNGNTSKRMKEKKEKTEKNLTLLIRFDII